MVQDTKTEVKNPNRNTFKWEPIPMASSIAQGDDFKVVHSLSEFPVMDIIRKFMGDFPKILQRGWR